MTDSHNRVYQHTFSQERQTVDAKVDEYFHSLFDAVSCDISCDTLFKSAEINIKIAPITAIAVQIAPKCLSKTKKTPENGGISQFGKER